MDQIIIGAITGGIGGLGNAALDEKTWKGSSGDSVMALFGGLIKGGLAGAATASVTQSIEALGRNAPALRAQAEKLAAGGALSRVAGVGLKGVSKVGGAIGAGMNASSEGGLVKGGLGMAGRGLTKASISAAGGMAGKATELAVDSGTGKFKGDMGAALVEIGHAGLHSFVQGFGEGAAESVGQGIQNRSQKASGARINSERERMGLKPLQGDALHAAVEDLQFLDTHGRNGNDALGRAINLDHIATHGGLIEAPVAAPAAGRATPHATEAEGATPRHSPGGQRRHAAASRNRRQRRTVDSPSGAYRGTGAAPRCHRGGSPATQAGCDCRSRPAPAPAPQRRRNRPCHRPCRGRPPRCASAQSNPVPTRAPCPRQVRKPRCCNARPQAPCTSRPTR